MRPVLLRPPLPRSPSVRAFTGLPFHNSLRSTITSWRRDGVVGLNVFSATAQFPSSNTGRHIDTLTLAKGHDRLFVIGTPAGAATNPLELSHDTDRVHRGHIDAEQPFDSCLHFALGGRERHAKDPLAVLGYVRRLLRDHRTSDDVVHLLPREPRCGGRYDAKAAHLRRAS